MSTHSLTTDAIKVLKMPLPGNTTRPPAQTRQTKGKPSVNLTPASGGHPSKSKETGLKSQYYIGIDWFEATLTGGVLPIENGDESRPVANLTLPVPTTAGLLPGTLQLIHNQKARKNKHYRYGFDLLFIPTGAKVSENRAAMIGKYRVASLTAIPHKGNNCMDRSCIFQADNHILYREDCWGIFDAVFAAMGANVHHLTRLDIALDGRNLLAPADEYHRQKMEVCYGRRKVSTLDKLGRATYDTDNWKTDDSGKVKNFYVGSMASKKVVNGYAKGERIELENKQYIREAWRASGLIVDDGKDVERIELRLRKDGVDDLHRVNPETGEVDRMEWQRLRDTKYLAGALRASLTGFYGFKRDNGLHRSKWSNVETINWKALETATVVRIPRTKRPSQVWRAKHTAYKLLTDCAVHNYLQDAVTDYVSEQMQNYKPSAETVENLAWGASLGLTTMQKKELVRLSRITSEQIALDITDYLSKTILPAVPEVVAWEVAKEHSVDNYLARRIRKDLGAKDYPLHILPPASRSLNVAA